MATETERKFLVAGEGWRQHVIRTDTIQQAYLATDGPAAIRVRIKNDSHAILTIKSANPGRTRKEFEYGIPIEDARELIKLCVGQIIDKQRHIVEMGNERWEIDEFGGTHRGLVIAEIELTDPAGGVAVMPDWIGDEVTNDRRYYNADLAQFQE